MSSTIVINTVNTFEYIYQETKSISNNFDSKREGRLWTISLHTPKSPPHDKAKTPCQ